MAVRVTRDPARTRTGDPADTAMGPGGGFVADAVDEDVTVTRVEELDEGVGVRVGGGMKSGQEDFGNGVVAPGQGFS